MIHAMFIAFVLSLASGVLSTIAQNPHEAQNPAPMREVDLELITEQKGDHIIGDRIPLLWRFTNRSAEPLGFLWEGCCRLNGRLTPRRGTNVVSTVPSGQALAHMFAKAEKLVPGVPKDFETTVSDWVELKESDTYSLEGMYVGVLPTQKPQVPKGLNLWTNLATSPPATVTVLSVVDYMRQRAQREKAVGLSLSLSGPARVDPIRKQTYEILIQNLSESPKILEWPQVRSVWVVDKAGVRHAAPGMRFIGEPKAIEVASSESRTIQFELDAESFEGEPFGAYEIFFELRSQKSVAVRVPSNAITLGWRLEQAEVQELILAASLGAKTGGRNAPLKLLRTHLGVIESPLAAITPSQEWSPRAMEVLRQLQRAAKLAPLRPARGRFEVILRLDGQGSMSWEHPVLRRVIPMTVSWSTAFGELLQLRRHLGWEMSLRLQPQPSTSFGEAIDALRISAEFSRDLADAPALALAPRPSDELSNANLLTLWETGFDSGLNLDLKNVSTPSQPRISGFMSSTSQPPASPQANQNTQEIKSPHALSTMPLAPSEGSRKATISAERTLRWEQVAPWLMSLLERGFTIALRTNP